MKKAIAEKLKGLINGVDYEVMSLEVFTNDGKIYPIERKLNVKIEDLLKDKQEGESNIDAIAKKIDIYEECVYDSPAPSIMGGEFIAVRIDEKLINQNLIVDCGLGLIKLKSGSYYLYNAHNDSYLFDLMIGIYMTIVDEKYFNSNIRRVFRSSDSRNTLNGLIQVTEEFDLYEELLKALQSKMGGDNILRVDFGEKNE